LIARYSNYQISDSEIKGRQKISKLCIAACTLKYKDALQTIKELEECKKCKLADLRAQIKTAHETHCHAF
jgi:hypothetical protein